MSSPGFNLVTCYYALNDKEKMKLAFQKLLTTDLKQEDDDKYISHSVSIVDHGAVGLKHRVISPT